MWNDFLCRHRMVFWLCGAEFRYFQQSLGVGDNEDAIEAGPNPADFMDQLRHIDGGGLPDGNASNVWLLRSIRCLT